MSLRGSESAPAVPDAAVHATPAPNGLHTKPPYMPQSGCAETATIRRFEFAYFEPDIIRIYLHLYDRRILPIHESVFYDLMGVIG